MFLVDTNIFLEILLKRNNKENCRKFLENNIGNLHMTDFSLHSIGVILFKYNKEDVFKKFSEDILLRVKLLSLPIELYVSITDIKEKLNLNFDDAYQYSIAKHHELKIVTMDRDFENVEDVEVVFL